MRLARPFVPYAFLIALIFSVTQGAAQAKGNSLRIDSERRLEPVSIAPRKIQKAETPTPSYFGEERDEKEQVISASAPKDLDSSWHYDGALTYDGEASPDEGSEGNHPGNQIGQKPDLARPPPELIAFVAPKSGLTNPQLIQKAGQKAFDKIPGKGGAVGTARHEYATKLLDRYQGIYGDKGLRFKETRSLFGQKSILDARDIHSKTIFDWKFGNSARMSPAQRTKYQSHYPDHTIQVEKYLYP